MRKPLRCIDDRMYKKHDLMNTVSGGKSICCPAQQLQTPGGVLIKLRGRGSMPIFDV